MKGIFTDLLVAVVTAVIPVLTVYLVSMIKKAGDNVAADTESIKLKRYIEEITTAISTAVSYTSQTYVDALKEARKFTAEAQKEALQRSLDTAISILSPAAAKFIQDVYGDLGEFIKPLIEAEVRKQKTEAPAAITLPVMECDTDATAVAASTAAATAATYLQTAFNQLDAEAVKKEKAEE